MYIPDHFKPQELVPPDVYQRLGDKSWLMIDDRVLITLDKLRDAFGVLTVNDYCYGGHFEQSGLRTTDSKYYSPTSQHTFGRAADCHFSDFDAETIRQEIILDKAAFPHIHFIEADVNWLHFDVRNCTPITVWSPDTKKSYIA